MDNKKAIQLIEKSFRDGHELNDEAIYLLINQSIKAYRYREALENILQNWVNSTDAISGDVLAHEFSQIARQALEQESKP